MLLGNPLEIAQTAEHGDAGELEPDLCLVVVDEADGFEAQVSVGEELAEGHLAGHTRAGDERAPGVGAPAAIGPGAPATYASEQPRGGENEDREKSVSEQDGERDADWREVARQNDDAKHGVTERYGKPSDPDQLELGNARVPPEAAVHAEGEADGEGERELCGGKDERGGAVTQRPVPTFKAEGIDQERRHSKQERVEKEDMSIPDLHFAGRIKACVRREPGSLRKGNNRALYGRLIIAGIGMADHGGRPAHRKQPNSRTVGRRVGREWNRWHARRRARRIVIPLRSTSFVTDLSTKADEH